MKWDPMDFHKYKYISLSARKQRDVARDDAKSVIGRGNSGKIIIFAPMAINCPDGGQTRQ